MAEPSQHDLILYVLGEASPEMALDIEAQARQDDCLAAKLNVMRWFMGAPMPEDGSSPTGCCVARWRRWLVGRRNWLAAACVLLLAGVGWSGYALLVNPPLLEDNFNGRWFDAGKWLGARPVLRQEDGHLRLSNRGAIVTQQEYPQPVSLSFRWRWLDLAGDPLNADHLTIALRTRGFFNPARPFEVQDGILVKLNASSGAASIQSVTEETLISQTAIATLPMPADLWHTVRITDDGETICLYLAGPNIPREHVKTPVLQLHSARRGQEYHIAIYNREFVADATHESHIDDFLLERLH